MTTMLIDSSFLAYQAMAVHGSLKNDDVMTGVVYGIFSRILSIGSRFKTNDFHFCFDGPRDKSIRRKLFPGPDDDGERQQMYSQLELFRQIIADCGWPVYYQEEFETDDIIAALVKQPHDGHDSRQMYIVSSDGDLHQLLGNDVFLFHPTKHLITRESDLPYRANEVVMMKAIGGCSSDTVPGVPGVAATRALQFIRGDYNHLTPPKWVYSIREDPDRIARNLKLVRLPHEDMPEMQFKSPALSFETFQQYCRDLGFESFLTAPLMWGWSALFHGDYQTLNRKSSTPSGVVSRRATRREQTEGFGL
jgi:5'-3' exonuclease